VSARVFLDTNVFVYSLDLADPDKQVRALQLIDERRRDIVVSTQVLLELHSVCTRKLGLTRHQADTAVRSVAKFPVVEADRELVLQASQLADDAQLSIFDAAIVVAARRAGCRTILSEDLGPNQKYGDLAVENPFG
jgi:predicted nucleic acid-binding protein